MKKRRQNAKVSSLFEKKGKRKRGRVRYTKGKRKLHRIEQDDRDTCGSEDSSVDRISMLPDDLLGLIVSHLTIKEWVATSILSRRWKYLWTIASPRRLNFNGIDSLVRLAFSKENGASSLEKEKLSYVNWVNRVLASRRDSDIEDFNVCFNLSKNDEGCVDEWLRYALARKVETLELNLIDEGCSSRREVNECYVFPFRFLQENPSNSIHFKQLKKILLNYVNVNGEALEFLLHNCPLLEDLSVSRSLILEMLWVIGPFPSLKRLEISSCSNFNELVIRDVNLVCLRCIIGRSIYIVLKNLPMLVNVSVTHAVFQNGTMMPFLSILQQIEILNLYGVDGAICFPVKMSNLKQLMVSTFCDFLPMLPNLLRSAPCLQKFVYQVTHNSDYYRTFHDWELQTTYIKKKNVKKSYSKLEEVKFVGFCGVPSDFELVYHFVDYAAALKKIVIDPKKPCTAPYEHKFRKNAYTMDEIAKKDRERKKLEMEVPSKIKVVFLNP